MAGKQPIKDLILFLVGTIGARMSAATSSPRIFPASGASGKQCYTENLKNTSPTRLKTVN